MSAAVTLLLPHMSNAALDSNKLRKERERGGGGGVREMETDRQTDGQTKWEGGRGMKENLDLSGFLYVPAIRFRGCGLVGLVCWTVAVNSVRPAETYQ